jgi:hypothetical protein
VEDGGVLRRETMVFEWKSSAMGEMGRGMSGHGDGQDKAAGQMPVRSVSTPRYGKQLGGAPTLPHGCTAWKAFPSAIRPSRRAGKSLPRGVLS